MLSIVAGAASSAGRVRVVNEDAYFLGSSLFLVADGMGGHRAGDRASSLAIEHLARIADRQPKPHDILAAINDANDAIVDEAEGDETRRGMGTTLVGLSLTEFAGSPHWWAFNVGDSRLYEFESGRLHQLTVDHSEVQEMVEAGEIRAEESAAHPLRNVITRSIGTRPAPVIDSWLLPLAPRSVYMLCSDGLTTELALEQIAHLLHVSASPQLAADRLVEAAEVAGGHDNITVIVVAPQSTVTSQAPETPVEQTLPRPLGGDA